MSLKPSVLGVIPARYQSTRFPGKSLALIQGKPMIEWVYKRAKKALPHVVVATDDKRIFNAVKKFGGRVLMTPKSCKTGTDRMFFVSKKIKAAYYANIQGDEPLIDPGTIRGAVKMALRKKAIATSATTLSKKERHDPGAVKVVIGKNAKATYFTRLLEPSEAKQQINWKNIHKHLGLYVYPKKKLSQFVKWPQPDIEKRQRLEQLRAVHFGEPIYVALTKHSSIGIDTPADLSKVRNVLKNIRHPGGGRGPVFNLKFI